MMSSQQAQFRGFVMQIHVPSGVPDSLRVVSKDNWNGEGAFFSRTSYSEVRTGGSFDFERTGVYVLWGPADESDLLRVYVGEADHLRNRLNEQFVQLDFWTNAVAFCSSNQNLNKAHVRHIEARLIALADEAKRCLLENANAPRIPHLSPGDRDTAENYLSDMLLCLPVLGVNFFERTRPRDISLKDLTINSTALRATGYEDVSGFVVREGSQTAKNETKTIRPTMSDLRADLLKKGVLVDKNDAYEFTQDYSFSAPTTAANAILGSSSTGLDIWKGADGRTLKQIREEQSRSE